MLDSLKQELVQAIRALKQHNFYSLNQESISLCDRGNSLLVTAPAHLSAELRAEDMLICDTSCTVVEGSLLASTALPAHLELYRAFPEIGAVVHSHGTYTTAWAQAGRDIPIYGVTHLEHFAENIPCTRAITPADAEEGYSTAVGACIAETFQKKGLDFKTVPAALVFQHGAYVWGANAVEAAARAIALEQIAHLAFITERINPSMVDARVPITQPEQFK